MKTMIVIALAVLAQAIGNTCLSMGMKAIGQAYGADESFSVMIIFAALGSPLIWIGIILMIAFFALFSAALSWADLSFVLPASASGYVLNLALAHHYLNETISTARWAGTVLIILGIVLVSRSGAKDRTENSGYNAEMQGDSQR